jgi:hypothetical protein
MLEKAVEGKVCAYAKSMGFRAFKQEWPGTHGAPDRLLISPHGHLFMIEFKAPGKKLSAHQNRRIKDLISRGVEVYIIDDIETGKLVINLYNTP